MGKDQNLQNLDRNLFRFIRRWWSSLYISHQEALIRRLQAQEEGYQQGYRAGHQAGYMKGLKTGMGRAQKTVLDNVRKSLQKSIFKQMEEAGDHLEGADKESVYKMRSDIDSLVDLLIEKTRSSASRRMSMED